MDVGRELYVMNACKPLAAGKVSRAYRGSAPVTRSMSFIHKTITLQ